MKHFDDELNTLTDNFRMVGQCGHNDIFSHVPYFRSFESSAGLLCLISIVVVGVEVYCVLSLYVVPFLPFLDCTFFPWWWWR